VDVRRMTMPWITAVVLREDVENTLRAMKAGSHEITYCPIERALCRAMALPLGNIAATYDGIEVRDWKACERIRGVPTKKMIRAMESFDETGEMKPSLFRIKLEPVA
jgi:hypothetical protein